MSHLFSSKANWCESKDPNIQKICKVIASEEVKQFASVVVIIFIVYRILDAFRHPVKKAYQLIKKNYTNDKSQETDPESTTALCP